MGVAEASITWFEGAPVKVRLLHELAKVHASFDDPDLVSRTGLVPVMALAQRAGLGDLAGENVRIARPCGVNAQLKVSCLVAGMVAGADSIDDMDLLRHGAMPALFGGIRAPSTLGSFLRSFTWGNVLQLEKVSRCCWESWPARTPLLPSKDVLAFTDVDSTQKRVCGHAKQGAAFGHTKIQGKPAGARAERAGCDDQHAADSARDRRREAARRQRGLLPRRRALRHRGGGHRPRHGMRRDSGGAGGLGVLLRRVYRRHPGGRGVLLGHRPDDPKVKATIAAIPGTAWIPIRYPRAIWDDQLRRWVSDAEVAEVPARPSPRRRGRRSLPG
jgi:hypothetical protein